VDLRQKTVLEVGSGRGGGADYVSRYLKPMQMIGVDFSKNAVKHSTRNYSVDGLSFEVGDAADLPFSDDSFHAVINIESSHCYTSMEDFLSQVKRVLHNKGYFLFADFRDRGAMGDLRETLQRSGMSMVKESDISANVYEALKLDSERKANLIKKTVHKPLVQSFLEFAGTRGTRIYEKFKSGEKVYYSFVLQK
jgi:ubiquinone/menaquinone biosynthesis C-methylase UbiE